MGDCFDAGEAIKFTGGEGGEALCEGIEQQCQEGEGA